MDIDEYRRGLLARIQSRLDDNPQPPALARFAAGPLASGSNGARGAADDTVGEAISIAAATARPSEERLAALSRLRAARFATTRFAPFEEPYLQLLRHLIDDPSEPVRASALETLAIARDSVARKRLVAALDGAGSALLPPAKIIQLLGYDDHAEVAAVVRDMLARTNDVATWDEGLRLLAGDPASADLLVATLRDSNAAAVLRRTSARALQALDPELFRQEAERLIVDPGEDDDLRAASLTLLGQGRAYASSRRDPRLRAGVEDVARQSASEQVRSAAASFLEAHSDGAD